MPAVIIELADAVVAALNGATLSQTFEAERGYVPTLNKQDEEGVHGLAELKVVVMARDLSMATQSRGGDEFDYGVDIGVFQKIGTGDVTDEEAKEACDPLMEFVEEIADLFRGGTVIDDLPARFQGLTIPSIYDPEELRQKQIFASKITLSFKRSRAR